MGNLEDRAWHPKTLRTTKKKNYPGKCLILPGIWCKEWRGRNGLRQVLGHEPAALVGALGHEPAVLVGALGHEPAALVGALGHEPAALVPSTDRLENYTPVTAVFPTKKKTRTYLLLLLAAAAAPCRGPPVRNTQVRAQGQR